MTLPIHPARSTDPTIRPHTPIRASDNSGAEVHDVVHAGIAELAERQRRVIRKLFVDDRSRHWCAAFAARLQLPIDGLGPTRERALPPRDAVTPSQHRCLSIVVRRPIDTHGLVRTDAVDPIRRLPWPLR